MERGVTLSVGPQRVARLSNEAERPTWYNPNVGFCVSVTLASARAMLCRSSVCSGVLCSRHTLSSFPNSGIAVRERRNAECSDAGMMVGWALASDSAQYAFDSAGRAERRVKSVNSVKLGAVGRGVAA